MSDLFAQSKAKKKPVKQTGQEGSVQHNLNFGENRTSIDAKGAVRFEVQDFISFDIKPNFNHSRR